MYHFSVLLLLYIKYNEQDDNEIANIPYPHLTRVN